jgi:beta-lactamase superfamily II metal-dependent hydrolase
MKKIKLYIFLILIFVLTGACSKQPDDIGFMDVFVFATGKADAILITTENHAVMIDAGENKHGTAIADYLTKRGIDTIDYLIITHFHKDHVGGADTIIRNFDVKEVIVPNYGKQSKQYSQFVSAAVTTEIENKIIY